MKRNATTSKKIIFLICLVLLIIISNVVLLVKEGEITGYKKVINKIMGLDEEIYIDEEFEEEIIEKEIETLTSRDFTFIEDLKWPTIEQNGTIQDDFAIVKEAKISNIIDGTGPWDIDNNPGNDSGANNRVIRTFDKITYDVDISLTANTEKNPSLNGQILNGGYIFIQATLDDGEYYWDLGSMNWASAYWGKVSKDKKTLAVVVKRNTERDLQSGSDTLHLVVDVLGEANGKEIPLPEITTWVNGNTEDERKNIIFESKEDDDGTITVSATKKYNIHLRSTGTDSQRRAYVNVETGKVFSKKEELEGREDASDFKNGRFYGMSVSIELNKLYTAKGESKGFKGSEMPQTGEVIQVDLDCYLTADNVRIANEKPILWNYNINGIMSGKITKNQLIGYDNAKRDRYVPAGVWGYYKNEVAAYDSGEISAIDDNGKITLTFKNCKANGNFPIKQLCGNKDSRLEKVGSIAVGYVQLFVEEPNRPEGSKQPYYVNVSAGGGTTNKVKEDMDATEITIGDKTYYQATGVLKGNTIEGDVEKEYWTDDFFSANYVFGVKGGTYNHIIQLYKYSNSNVTGKYLGNGENAGDGKAILGQEFIADFFIVQSVNNDVGGTEIKEINRLIKFDASGLELLDFTNDELKKLYKNTELNCEETERRFFSHTGDMDWKMWYVTKVDGTNWENDDEMQEATIKDLKVYENKEDIKDNLVVGVYFEGTTESPKCLDVPEKAKDQYIKLKFKMKNDATIGNVYMFKQDDYFYNNYFDRSIYTIDNFIDENNNVVNEFKADKTYNLLEIKNSEDKTINPIAVMANGDSCKYTKSVFNEFGEYTKTHDNWWKGMCILAVGAEVELSKEITDKTVDLKAKTVYDISNNEYEVNYKLSPKLVQLNSGNADKFEGIVTVKDILPKGLEYKEGSSSFGEPNIVKDLETGITTLTWEIPSCKADTAITPITYTACIDKGMPANTEYKTNAIAYCKTAGSSSEQVTVTISTVELGGRRIYKEVMTPVINADETIHYKIVFAKDSTITENNFKILDVLPYNDDARGTKIHGTYTIEKMEIAGGTNIKVYTTSEESIRSNENIEEWTEVDEIENINKEATALLITGELKNIASQEEKIEIDVYLKTLGNLENDVYVNTTKELNSELESTKVNTVVIKKNIEGTVWLDTNSNGLMDDGEDKLEGILVKLLDENGEAVKNKNGETISVLTGTYGKYKFENLPKGKYIIKIETNDYYDVTNKNVGEDISKNSKVNEDKTKTTYKNTDIIEDLNIDGSINLKNINAGLKVSRTNIKVEKIWEDNNNEQKKRPSEITINLMNGETKVDDETLNDTYKNSEDLNKWEYVFENLEKYDKVTGNEINYTVEETGEGTLYTKEITGNKEDGYIVKNTFTPPTGTINITVDKKWEDNNNEQKKRPSAIYIQINGGESLVEEKLTASNKKGENENIWTYTFEGLPKYKENGDEIAYSVSERAENTDDLLLYALTETKGNIESGYEITNTFIIPPDKIKVNVTKVWEDNDKPEKRPQDIYLQIKNGDLLVQESTANAENSWKCEFEVAKYDSITGDEIAYSVSEREKNEGDLLYYDKLNVTGNQVEGFIITNKFKVTDEKLTSNITKEVNKQEIKVKDEEIPYTIKYTANIDDYIGTAKILITDELPYEIDLDKSDIAGGIYDKANKKITWEEEVTEINTFLEDIPKETEIIKNIKLVYTNYEVDETKTDNKLKNTAKGKIELKTTGKTEEKQAEAETKINLVPGKVIVKHYLEGTTEELAPSTEQTGKIGTGYSTTEFESLLEEYELVSIPTNKEGTYKLEDQEVIYYYRKRKGKLIVNYIEKATGKELLETETGEEKVGTDYETKLKNIKYYKLVDVEGEEKGKYKVGETKVTYYYEKLIFNLGVEKKLYSYSLNGVEILAVRDLEKLEIPKKEVNNTKLELKYKIVVRNNGEIEGTAEVIENIPNGFSLKQVEGTNWKLEGKIAKLTTEEIKPGESKEYEIILVWHNEEFGTIKNIVNLGGMENLAGYADTNNLDNQDEADFIVAIKTGIKINPEIGLAFGIMLEMIAGALFIVAKRIKK